jgi:hypothetical protein
MLSPASFSCAAGVSEFSGSVKGDEEIGDESGMHGDADLGDRASAPLIIGGADEMVGCIDDGLDRILSCYLPCLRLEEVGVV